MKTITTSELVQKLTNKEGLTIIDVREPFELLDGQISGVKNIPLGELPDRIGELNKEEHLYLICRSGARSEQACMFLMQHGFEVTNITGGMLSYTGPVCK